MDLDTRLLRILFVLAVGFRVNPVESCSTTMCQHVNKTCIEDATAKISYCNNCSNDKVGKNCNIDNPCITTDCPGPTVCKVVINKGAGLISVYCSYTTSACSSSPCENKGYCTEGKDGGFSCRCPSQWEGLRCEKAVDACLSSPCLNSGTCKNTPQGFFCFCMTGWNGTRCDTNIDDCVDKPCSNNGTCVDKVASYQCLCPPHKAGLRCQFENKCWDEPCGSWSRCDSRDESYTCTCAEGWTGENCENDIDECNIAVTPICEQNGACVNTLGSFRCVCPRGITGTRCESPVEHCKPDICKNGGTCITKVDKYECYCLDGFIGENCEEAKDCGNLNCHKGKCIVSGGKLKCNCPANTTGENCEFDLSGKCLSNGSCSNQDCSKCQNGAQCNGNSGCQCKPVFYGRYCQFRNSCSSNPCQNGGSCRPSEDGTFTCTCYPPYLGKLCEMRDVCSERPCLNGGLCLITGPVSNENRHCSCLPGFSGDSCETNLTDNCLTCKNKPSVCSSTNPCVNGGMCSDYPNLQDRFACRCSNKWSGKTCNVSICDHCRCCKSAEKGKCNDECNMDQCQLVQDECGLSGSDNKLYKNCPFPTNCSKNFQNGVCDQYCNNEQCLYDGLDCRIKPLTCPVEDYCKPRFENGYCDKECFNALCQWDGTDCYKDPSKETEYVQGIIIMRLQITREKLESKYEEFLYYLSQQIMCTVKLYKNQDGSPSIVDDIIPGFGQGSKIHLKLVYTKAQGPCFSQIDLAGNFIKKLNENGNQTDIPIYDVSTAPDPSSPGPSSVFIIIGAVFCVLIVVVLVGIYMKKRKKVDKTWFPPGFLQKSKSCIRSSTDQMSSGSEKQIIENNDSFSEESFYTGTLTKSSKTDFSGDPQGSIASSQVKIPHIGPNVFPSSSSAKLNQVNYFQNNFRPQMNMSLQDDIFSKLYNEAMANYDQTGETSLHLAARYSRADAAQKFLEDGADPNAQDHNGKTPLHVAIAADAVGVFQILLRCRTCSVNVQMKDGTTPLIYAVRLAIDGMVGDLIKAEADLNKTDDQGKTGLHWAAAVNNLDAAILLLHHGGLNRDAQDDKGQTPLFLAAKEGSFNVAQLLLHNSASMDLADQLDRLPRDIAMEKKHYDIVRLLDEYVSKTNQARGQSNFSDHLLVSEGNKGIKHKKSMGFSEIEGGVRSKKKRKIDASDDVSGAVIGNHTEMFVANFHHHPCNFENNPYNYIKNNGNSAHKQAYNQLLQWNRQNQNEMLFNEHLKIKAQKGLKRKNDLGKWLVGSTGSSPTDSDFAVMQSPNEGSNGSPGYCNNGGVFLSPPESDHYQHHMLAGSDVSRCAQASVIQRHQPNAVKNSQHSRVMRGRYDEPYHDRMQFSKPSNVTPAPYYNSTHNQPIIFQQYPTPPSQQFSPNGVSSSVRTNCLTSTQRENLFETPSPGSGDQWVDVSMTTCPEPHTRQQLDAVVSAEDSVC